MLTETSRRLKPASQAFRSRSVSSEAVVDPGTWRGVGDEGQPGLATPPIVSLLLCLERLQMGKRTVGAAAVDTATPQPRDVLG